MTFSAQILTDLDVFFNADEFSDKVITYAGTSVVGHVETDDLTHELQPDSIQGRLFIKASALGSAPDYRDTVVIDGVTWKTYRDSEDNAYYESAGVYIINIYRGERPRFF